MGNEYLYVWHYLLSLILQSIVLGISPTIIGLMTYGIALGNSPRLLYRIHRVYTSLHRICHVRLLVPRGGKV